MKPSDKQLAAGTLAFNECDIVSTPHCISAAYDAMTEVMTVEDVRAWAKGKGLALVPVEPTPDMRMDGWVALDDAEGTDKDPAYYCWEAMIKASEEDYETA